MVDGLSNGQLAAYLAGFAAGSGCQLSSQALPQLQQTQCGQAQNIPWLADAEACALPFSRLGEAFCFPHACPFATIFMLLNCPAVPAWQLSTAKHLQEMDCSGACPACPEQPFEEC
jgi:hypothetical protein